MEFFSLGKALKVDLISSLRGSDVHLSAGRQVNFIVLPAGGSRSLHPKDSREGLGRQHILLFRDLPEECRLVQDPVGDADQHKVDDHADDEDCNPDQNMTGHHSDQRSDPHQDKAEDASCEDAQKYLAIEAACAR